MPEYLETNELERLPVGSPIIYVDSGMAGEVSECLQKGDYVISPYVDTLVEDCNATPETITTFTTNHLTVDRNFVDEFILSELEAGTGELFQANRLQIARAAERHADAILAKAQQDVAAKKKRDAERMANPREKTKKWKKKKKNREEIDQYEELLQQRQENLRVSKQRMLFDLLDTDGSGEVDLDEMLALESIDGFDMTDRFLKVAFREMDVDGSGFVGFTLFKLWLDAGSELAQSLWEQLREELLLAQESYVHLAAMTKNGILIGGHVVDKANVDTVRACRCVVGGRWYYEVQLGDSASCKIGFASTAMVETEEQEEPGELPGLGQQATPGSSWAYDGSQGVKMHRGNLPYAAKARWKANDVVGCILDLEAGTIAYTLNGIYLGVAFKSVAVHGEHLIFPAMTLQGGPHWARFSRHEVQHAPTNCRLFSNGLAWNEVDDKPKSKIRRRAYRRAKLQAEELSNAWIEPKNLTAERFVGLRVDISGRGKATVEQVNKRGKHDVTFDDGTSWSAHLGSIGCSILDAALVGNHCNKVLADRERQLFEQRINQRLARAAREAAKRNDKKPTQSKRTATESTNDEAVRFANPLDQWDADEEEESAAVFDVEDISANGEAVRFINPLDQWDEDDESATFDVEDIADASRKTGKGGKIDNTRKVEQTTAGQVPADLGDDKGEADGAGADDDDEINDNLMELIGEFEGKSPIKLYAMPSTFMLQLS